MLLHCIVPTTADPALLLPHISLHDVFGFFWCLHCVYEVSMVMLIMHNKRGNNPCNNRCNTCAKAPTTPTWWGDAAVLSAAARQHSLLIAQGSKQLTLHKVRAKTREVQLRSTHSLNQLKGIIRHNSRCDNKVARERSSHQYRLCRVYFYSALNTNYRLACYLIFFCCVTKAIHYKRCREAFSLQ